MTPDGRAGRRRHLQQALHDPRRHHGVLLPRAGGPDRAGQFLPADDDRRQGPGLSADQPAELVSLHARRRLDASSPCWPAASIPAGPSTRPTVPHASHYNVVHDDDRRGDRRVLVAADGLELHRHASIGSAPGPDLVPAADLRLDDVRHEFHLPAGRAGAGHGADPGDHRARAADRHFRSGAGRRSAAVPASLLVLLASGRLHHDPAGHGRRQRGDPLLRPQAALRLQVRGLFELRHRLPGLLRLGAPHVRRRASRSTRR